MRVNTSRFTVKYLAHEARLKGETVSRFIGSGIVQCTTPVELHMFGYPDEAAVRLGLETDTAVAQRTEVRCRKCEGCLRHRARLWTARAIDETKGSTRTWFGTLTLKPDRQLWAKYSALSRMERRQSDMDDKDQVFRETVGFIAPEITRFLKRVRKVTPFRYLLVTEQHKSGDPHFHILVHEYEGKISKRVLEDKWRYGHSHWRLIQTGDEKACGYACKYLAKSAQTRVRGSLDYGRAKHRTQTERIIGATRVLSEAHIPEQQPTV